MIQVIKSGWLDLVMDAGRPGFRAQGVPAGGAADMPARVCANRCVGNSSAAAVLELTGHGPTLRFPEGGRVALSGADMPLHVDGEARSMNSPVELPRGALVQIGRSRTGLRAYLSVAGGINVPMVLGSHSTFLPGGFGGHQGRALKTGDVLRVGEAADTNGGVPGHAIYTGEIQAAIRVLPGPQVSAFEDKALLALLESAYRLLPDSNRMGLRLAGLPLKYTGGSLPTQAVMPGAIQVPPEGQPIVLGWDGPVTGGYPVIACVVTADLPRLAQCVPGESVRFEMLTREKGVQAWQELEGLWS